jgi:homogentisate 1,2-dioxygenase
MDSANRLQEVEKKKRNFSWATDFSKETMRYQSGFGNHHQSEALLDALPRNQNNPKKCNYGLVAE